VRPDGPRSSAENALAAVWDKAPGELRAEDAVASGLGRVAASHHRPSTAHRIQSHIIRCLCF
jgi:hypothetical protein